MLDNVRKNAIRQKIKSTRDHLLSNYVVDVMGKKLRDVETGQRGEGRIQAVFL